MSALAIAYHKKGYKVTGSDKGFYPPVSTNLTEAGIEYYPGWHVDKMTADGDPDVVIVGNVAGSENPEWQYVQEKKLEYLSYPEAIAKDFVQKNSVVVAGTYGKSTSASILAWVMLEAGFDPSYMFGGVSINDIPAATIGDSDYSVLEGDEYKSARWDNDAKFFHYSPTHLLLTSVVWDHADVYPTEESYVEAFEKLVKGLPKDGCLVVSEKVQKQITELTNCHIITYGKSEENEYRYDNVETTKHGTSFTIYNNLNTYNITTSSLGDYMADNITGCFVMAHQFGIEPEDIIQYLATYKNIKRRLEKRFDGDITVFDDIAHSPTKAEKVLESVRKLYNGKLIVVFEPNTGNRKSASLPGYDNAFVSADEVIIPRLSQVKVDEDDMDQPVYGKELSETIAHTHTSVHYIDEDERLIEYLLTNTKKGDVIAFLGSHGFRGMIDQLVSRVSK
ncbi:MAG: hypothetical protein CO029_00310 [Candidatus Magasanikbacteria bacterium CG_4_9_14_0_2_um_filter_41_10]|uniref:UDP-N-acetylmuramate:L-alanyl-gamma-D-glutamyl-meso-diaminopimelate ligase n=1 Tax=Candidatus Magasanikbacteria bacterium CG_4_10_14_0_2_um_filter_41_31 TaxID=1974639 RepID=A0A2M7V1U7_9BACT|nr:MAG: hypothetical protein AUJ37_00490 [Candidatus Magasanikbacteria bacterium CG1_02_41_34]PIZ92312.1 MAG: hypothetical protein COX83_04430 [Candidatus Magasanikbacteria bacterium CG_4_10_14_0_2_um_filter_41_31]PJC53911.1 MAG: hypothetical protein CO029_00310 [Candidatus Magasanikbacteria bacterium CG_4_9_14_0_2_um_filter_41_10]